ncbi:MAG: TonB-dependent receptor [Proteobacteria bacterium]|nr:TonB-dependent receptor [Pseudomonadota bacterium]
MLKAMRRRAACAGAWTAAMLHAVLAAAEGGSAPPVNPAAAQELPQVLIIGTAPLRDVGQPLEEVPTQVQTATAADLKRQQSLDITEYLNNNFSGISVNESQNNPFQIDVNYHGFTASPLLGAPQGMSVYVDGVRVNEAFGDTVNWDLIPESAISSVSLVSGSNPTFGLNTLGGALAVQTKSGHDYPGTSLQGYAGSFGRYAFEAETGGASGPFDYFLAANSFDEDGWRNFSPSRIRQIFGKVGWETESADIDLSYAWADTQLTGNGPVPQDMLAYQHESVYTAPDFTHNLLNFINATGTLFLDKELLLSGNLYYRNLRTRTNNGDVNDDNYQSGSYEGPVIDCAAPPASHADVAFCANGVNRASGLTQRTAGAGVQLTATRKLFGQKNYAALGASYDHADQEYGQTFQYATLTPLRQTVAIADPNNPEQTVTAVSGSSRILGIYFTDTISPGALMHITASARYNRINETLGGYSVDTSLRDFGDGFDEAAALSGDHTYGRLNPALGFTLTPSAALTFYANYNEGSRAPTVIELGCSDPQKPCGLPNAFLSDPDLKQVVSRTFEVGARGALARGALSWSMGLFSTENSDDIQFVATTTSQGYFANVGTTRRQGLDLALGGKLAALTWRASYSFIDATYRSSFALSAEGNSTADANGNIRVTAGDRIPLVPRNTARLRLDFALTADWDAGASVVATSGSYLHGNENNANQPDGAQVQGSGTIGGYCVVNMDTTYRLGKRADVFMKVMNVLDRRYATAGFLTGSAFNADGSFRPDPNTWTSGNSVSPAQPFAVWAGVRVHWD